MHTRGNREFRATGSHPRRLVFVTMGLDLPGGVANLSGSMVAALDSMVADSELDRVDVVSYLDSEPPKRHGEGFSDVAGDRVRDSSERFGKPIGVCAPTSSSSTTSERLVRRGSHRSVPKGCHSR